MSARQIADHVRRMARGDAVREGLVIGAVGAALGVMLYFDLTANLGAWIGIGYVAVLGIAGRLVPRLRIAAALLGTVGLCVPLLVVPQPGIANIAGRSGMIALLWVVAVQLTRRSAPGAAAETANGVPQGHEHGYVEIVRQVLLSNDPLEIRVRRLTKIAAQAMQVDFVGVYRVMPGIGRIRCLDVFDRRTNTHFVQPDAPINPDPEIARTFSREMVVAVEDVHTDPSMAPRRALLDELGVRSLLGAGIVVDGQPIGQITFGRTGEPQPWPDHHKTSARTMAALVTLLLSNDRLERANRRLEQSWRALDLLDEGVVAYDENGRPAYANRAAIAFAAWPEDRDGRRPLSEMRFAMPPHPMDGEYDETQISFKGRDLEVHRSHRPEGGMVARIADVTARNEALRERQQLQQRLQQAEKMEAIGQLAGGVAHDFNNILGSIMGFAALLVEDLPDASAQRAFAERIIAASKRGKELVDQILAFARARSIERGSVSLERIIEQCTDVLPGMLPASIHFRIATEATADIVFGSATQIWQLIVNLCTNARDATGENGVVSLSVGPADADEVAALAARALTANELIVGDIDVQRGYARIRVSDNGQGIMPDALPHIFEPFFTTKRRQRGSGVGLAVVHGVIQSHHGFCHVISAPGEGTTCTAYLPIVAAGLVAAPAPDSGEAPSMRGTERVLVVDDQSDIVDMLSIGLARLGYESVGVNDPTEALAAFEEDPGAWDVVVSDLMMPHMQGTELLKKIKAIRPDIKTILCTGYSEGLAAGEAHATDALIQKPVDALTIARSIRTLLG